MRDKTRRTRGTKARSAALPAQEEGAIIKDWGGRLPIALVYPNSYYLGMSNLGIHTIYGLLNGYPDVVCERVFWERESREKNLPPLPLESGRPLNDFAVIAFSVSYELDYFHVVKVLRASGIPLFAADRNEKHPLIIAGGPCITTNPVPLSPFFDCLCLGEAEAILPTILPVLIDGIGDERDRLLKTLASLPGIYAPKIAYDTPVVRHWAKNLNDFVTTSVILTPDTELGDLYLIEVERGCNRGCRFCLVNTTFAPCRFRSVDKLLEQASDGFRLRRRIGLVGPAVSDHPRIKELLAGLRQIGAELSISSLRIDTLSSEILNELAQGKVQTITVAPEAGSQRLRRTIKKGISDDDILEAIKNIAGQRIKQLKLYFMLGLPSETDDDIEDIIKLCLAAKDVLDRQRSNTRLNLNIAPFVPKAGTPFQWLPMAPLPTLNRRLTRLKRSLSPKGIKVKAESPAWSQVQGVLARGDTRVAEVLANIEKITLAGWRKAADKCRLDIDYYINQKWDIAHTLPWAFIDTGKKVDHLKNEMEKALAE